MSQTILMAALGAFALVAAGLSFVRGRRTGSAAELARLQAARTTADDERRRLIVEAKATVDGLFPAIGQVHRYRYLANLAAERTLVDRVAVLLPGEPCQEDLSCAASMYLDLDVIWQHGEGFEHQVLT